MQAFRISGTAPFGSQRQEFKIDLVAESAEDAEHQCYSIMGSRHKVGRRQLSINSINEIDPRTSLEPRVLNAFRDQIEAAGGRIAPEEEE